MREQLACVAASGLYDQASRFTIGLAGNEPDKQRFQRRFGTFGTFEEEIATRDVGKVQAAKLRLLSDSEHDTRFEYKTLLTLHQDACSDVFDIGFYFHTKGITRIEPTVRDWRLYMEYFLLERWHEAVSALQSGVCLYGVNWVEDASTGGEHPQIAPPHFAGNFFAARADYLRSLPPPSRDADFAEYEFWVGQNIGKPQAKKPDAEVWRVFCAHHSGVNHYYQPYPPERYRLQTV